jgi:hypothetical protein
VGLPQQGMNAEQLLKKLSALAALKGKD